MRKSLLMIVALWVVSFLFVLPNFIGWNHQTYDHETMSCIWDRQADFSYTLFFVATGIGCPMVMISVCYVMIYRHVRRSELQVRDTQAIAGLMSKKERMHSVRLARTLFVIFVTFATFWLPYALLVAIDVNDTFPLEVHAIAVFVAHTNSCINWFLYGATNRQFRKGYMQFLKTTKCGRVVAEKLKALTSEMKSNELSSATHRELATNHVLASDAKKQTVC